MKSRWTFLLLAMLAFPGFLELRSTYFVPQRPPLPQLLMKTSLDLRSREVYASATTVTDSGTRFGPGIYITCNAMPIVDTRSGTARMTSGAFVLPQDGIFQWDYDGPDTNFEVEMPADSQPVISDSMQGRSIFLGDSLFFSYQPSGPCSNVQLIVSDEFQDSIRPFTLFDPTTGALVPTWIGSLGLQAGAGTIAIARLHRIRFSSPAFSTIIVQDSSASAPVDVVLQ